MEGIDPTLLGFMIFGPLWCVFGYAFVIFADSVILDGATYNPSNETPIVAIRIMTLLGPIPFVIIMILFIWNIIFDDL